MSKARREKSKPPVKSPWTYHRVVSPWTYHRVVPGTGITEPTDKDFAITGPSWGTFAVCYTTQYPDGTVGDSGEYNAERIVTCVNACDGVGNEVLTPGVVARGLRALDLVERLHDALVRYAGSDPALDDLCDEAAGFRLGVAKPEEAAK